jgi:large subunit ribosomal protein L4
MDKKKPSKGKSPAKDIATIPVYSMNGKEVERFHLNKELFDGAVNKALLYQAVVMYNANKRQGTASTKTRGDVSGGGKKPWRQKGTGRARAGSTRSPLWRHGGVVFGPHPRNFHYTMPKKMIKLALLSGLNAKLSEEKMVGIDKVSVDEPKTKKVKSILNALKLKGKSLFVLDSVDEKLKRASKNLKELSLKNYRDFNLMDVLTCEKIVIAKAALEKLPERFTV